MIRYWILTLAIALLLPGCGGPSGRSFGVNLAEARRAKATAYQQEMKAKVTRSRALFVLAEAEIPAALAVAFRAGQLHARRPTATQNPRRRDTRLVVSTSDQIANPRQPRVDRVQPVNPNLKAKREHE